ncbi:hypothetical protein ACHAWU_005658 [Discostella pseudostelligera]|uniref:Uncharacterized protein n=1 Tax=Discostella pseudostelligera TaxID=259834 RepID=A0ABD3MWD8_9STRA
MMKAAISILGLVAVAASASSVAVADFVQLSQENPSDIDNYMRLRGGRELGKHKRQKAAEEELTHAMEAEEALVEAVETETALVQEFAKAEKRMKKEKKEKRTREKREKREKRQKTDHKKKEKKMAGPGKGRSAPHAEQPKEDRKNALKEGAPLASELMSKTSKPTDIGGTVSAPKGPEPKTPAHRERGESTTLSPSTEIPSFNPTISPTSERKFSKIQETSESPSSANNADEATSLPTFLPSFSPTGTEEYVEAPATTSSPSTGGEEYVEATSPSIAVVSVTSAPSIAVVPVTSSPSIAAVPLTSSPSSVVTVLVESTTTASTTAVVSTVSATTPVPTADPETSAPSANNDVEAISNLTSMPSYSPTGSPSTSSVETVPANTTTTPIISTSDAPTAPVVEVVAATPTTPSPSSTSVVVPTPTVTLTAVPPEDDASETVPDCPAAYDPTKTTYVGGDVITVNEHIFECQSQYEKYCNIAAWDDALLTEDANAKQSWDAAWMHISPCVAVTSDEV